MAQSSLTISPAAKTVATGAAVGMCAGFIGAPEKYSLKRLLVQDSDSFERIFSAPVTKKMNALERNAVGEIKKASSAYLSSGGSTHQNVRETAVEWARKFKSIPIDETLAQNLQNKKNYLEKVAEDNNFAAIRNQFTKATELLEADKDNSAMREYLAKVKQQYKIAKENLKQPIADYQKVVKQAYEQRVQNMKLMPGRGIEIKQAYEKMKNALAEERTVKTNKLYEMINQADLKKNYKSVSKFLPKARARAAANGALILGTLTAFGIIFFNPSPRN